MMEEIKRGKGEKGKGDFEILNLKISKS